MLTKEEETFFMSVSKDILGDELFLTQKKFIQHGDFTVYDHEINTAKLCLEYALRKNLEVNLPSLIRGALLHDFFLYDWHIRKGRKKLHGYRHPRIALEKASAHFSLNEIEKNMIRTHMWPLTLLHVPKCKEAWILTLMDKKETLTEMNQNEKNTYQ